MNIENADTVKIPINDTLLIESENIQIDTLNINEQIEIPDTLNNKDR